MRIISHLLFLLVGFAVSWLVLRFKNDKPMLVSGVMLIIGIFIGWASLAYFVCDFVSCSLAVLESTKSLQVTSYIVGMCGILLGVFLGMFYFFRQEDQKKLNDEKVYKHQIVDLILKHLNEYESFSEQLLNKIPKDVENLELTRSAIRSRYNYLQRIVESHGDKINLNQKSQLVIIDHFRNIDLNAGLMQDDFATYAGGTFFHAGSAWRADLSKAYQRCWDFKSEIK